MRIYLAARFSARHSLRAQAPMVRAKGHTISSRWVWTESLEPGVAGPAAYAEVAAHDLADIRSSDVMVVFTDSGWGAVGESGLSPTGPTNGGHYIETGIAIGLGKPVIVVGPRTSVFHYLPNSASTPPYPTALDPLALRMVPAVRWVGSLEEALEML